MATGRTTRLVEEVVEHVAGLDDVLLDERLRHLEVHRRRVVAEQALAVAVADSASLWARDGHHSMNGYLRATFNCSTAEATRWRRLGRLLDTVPVAAEALLHGRIGVEQAHELARVRANPRCGDRLREVADVLVGHAERLELDDFRTCVRRWELLADEDGAHRDRERSHESRNAAAVPAGSGVDLRASGGDPVTAAEMIAVLDAFTQAEFDADHAARAAEFGDDAAHHPYTRTAAQRRFDALATIFRRAAAAPTASGGRLPVTVNVMVDARTLTETMVDHHLAPASALAATATASSATATATATVTGDGAVTDPGLVHRRCETAAGTPMHPDDVLLAAIHGHVRRVVVDGAGLVVDLGRRRRLFTGAAREAAQMSARRCTRPGCTVPAEMSQIDHLHDHARGGATSPENGAPACGTHNRQKNRGYRAVRDLDGRVVHYRADGRAIVAAGQPEPLPDDPNWRCWRVRFDHLRPLDPSSGWC